MITDPGAPKVQVSSDGLSATMRIPMPAPGENTGRLSKIYLMDCITKAGVTFGVDQDKVEQLANMPVYDRDFVIATGNPSQEGVPGHFDFHFDLTLNKKPIIREDGSTDYMNIKMCEMVHKDQIIADYIPAVQGARGMSVRGMVIEPKPVRDVPPLAGRGFARSYDGMQYIALLDGKIDMSGNRILISPVWEIDSDVDISMGNIDFNGDVVVHGGVSDGAIIKAAGNVTIDGLVENCTIHSGKDLFLLSGVKGGEKTVIEVGGNLTAQFIEYAFVSCKGNIIADYMFNSKIYAEGFINLNGNKAAIIGGYTSAVGGIETNDLGNSFGTITTVASGITTEKLVEFDNLRRRVEGLSENIEKIKKGLANFDKLGEERGVDYKEDPRRIQLLRVKIRDEALILEEQTKLEAMRCLVENGRESTIKVYNKSYPGVALSIDDHKIGVKDIQSHVEYIKTDEGIRMDIIYNLVRE